MKTEFLSGKNGSLDFLIFCDERNLACNHAVSIELLPIFFFWEEEYLIPYLQ